MKSNINVSLIEDYLRSNNLSKSSFCKKCHIANNTYEKIINNDYTGSVLALWRISQQMDIRISELFI